MGLLSWIWPSEAERIEAAKAHIAAERWADAREALWGIEGPEALEQRVIAETALCRVNLEHAVTPSTLLGGHVVQGHIDGVGRVRDVVRHETEHRLRIEPPATLLPFRYAITDNNSTFSLYTLSCASAAALSPTILQDRITAKPQQLK